MLKSFLGRWNLVPDGEAFRSLSSDLMPVVCDSRPAMLKVPFNREERFGSRLMRYWAGDGAAELFRFDDESGALVLERARGPQNLAAMAEAGADEGAIRILCDVLAHLHLPRRTPAPELLSLGEWFEALPRAAASRGGFYARSWDIARALLGDQRELVPLHGDMHHGNVLDFGPRGWLAIDPKHVRGDRAFDYVNLLRNPDPDSLPDPQRFRRHACLIAEYAGIEHSRLMQWTLAFAGLSAAWIADDGDEPAVDLMIGKLAAETLG